jgi:hypothetical protein
MNNIGATATERPWYQSNLWVRYVALGVVGALLGATYCHFTR